MSYISKTEINEMEITKCKILGIVYKSENAPHGSIFPIAVELNGEFRKLRSLDEAYMLFPSDGGIFYYDAYNEENPKRLTQSSTNMTFQVNKSMDIDVNATELKRMGHKPWIYAPNNLPDDYLKKAYQLNFNKNSETATFPIIVNINKEYLPWLSSGYMDIENLHIDTSNLHNGCKFYLENTTNTETKLFGPFKAISSDSDYTFRPYIGKSINVYTMPATTFYDTYSFKGAAFIEYILNERLLSNYKDNIEIDCSTHKQLITWLKDKFAEKISDSRNKKLEDINNIFNDLKKVDTSALQQDMTYFNRALSNIKLIDNYIDWEEDKYKQLAHELTSNSTEFNKAIAAFVAKKQEEALQQANFKIDEYTELTAEAKKEYEESRSKLEAAIKNLEDKKELAQQNLDATQKQLNLLENNKQGILDTIKLQLDLGLIGNGGNSKDQYNEKISYYQSIGTCISDNINDIGIAESMFYSFVRNNTPKVYQSFRDNLSENNNTLLYKRAMFIPSPSWAYLYANALGKSRLLCLSVEHDWLHFKDFANHGLTTIWKDAHENPDWNYVLLLEGINITTVECGLRPLLDVIDHLRPTLADTGLPMPKNLKIFATVLSQQSEMGTALRAERFKNWGAVGNPEEQLHVDFSNLESKNYLPPEVISKLKCTQPINAEETKEKYLAF